MAAAQAVRESVRAISSKEEGGQVGGMDVSLSLKDA
jgi:hypothetical protein